MGLQHWWILKRSLICVGTKKPLSVYCIRGTTKETVGVVVRRKHESGEKDTFPVSQFARQRSLACAQRRTSKSYLYFYQLFNFVYIDMYYRRNPGWQTLSRSSCANSSGMPARVTPVKSATKLGERKIWVDGMRAL